MKKITKLDIKYNNYRWFFTTEGSLVVGGKSDEQNEVVLKNFLKPNYVVMHTTEPGSPFMIIQSDKPSKKDMEETAIFCACFSQSWKLGKKAISIDVFTGEQIFKIKSMKKGTFGVKGIKKTILAKPELAIVLQNGKLRAVPISTKEEILAYIIQGKLSKEEASEKLSKKIKQKYAFPISKDEIMSALPSAKMDVK
ncbi:MAG: NFACT RNA binding domain-containing protein [Candidatus Pacearchaeota archaeon]|jgi:hypothetical protein